jgi:hypothetical protein
VLPCLSWAVLSTSPLPNRYSTIDGSFLSARTGFALAITYESGLSVLRRGDQRRPSVLVGSPDIAPFLDQQLGALDVAVQGGDVERRAVAGVLQLGDGASEFDQQ